MSAPLPKYVGLLEGLGFAALGISFLTKAIYANKTPTAEESAAMLGQGARTFGAIGESNATPGKWALEPVKSVREKLITQYASELVKHAADRGAKVTRFEVHSIEARVKAIGDLISAWGANAKWKELAGAILSRRCKQPEGSDGGWCVPEQDWDKEAVELFNWVRRNVRYTRDPATVDAYSSPDRSIATRSGDCDDFCIVLGSLLRASGVGRVKMRVVRTRNERTGTPAPDYDHIYLVADPGNTGKWMALDASQAQKAGWEVEGAATVVKTGKPSRRVHSVRDFPVPL